MVFFSIEQPSKQVVRPVKGAITEYKFGDASGYGFVCDLYLFLGSNPVWSTRGSKQSVTYLAEVRINRPSRHSV